jgi:hypothetical protein
MNVQAYPKRRDSCTKMNVFDVTDRVAVGSDMLYQLQGLKAQITAVVKSNNKP